ncbi:MAG: hypothetical protein N2692_02585 [Patescibacteria group bacterium]|jgi:hypothetical protein|nr:hypothetical protein [Patescibacteria group bacterium]
MSLEKFPKPKKEEQNLSGEKLMDLYEEDEAEKLEKMRAEFEVKYRKMIEENKLDEEDKKEIESLKSDILTGNPNLSPEELEQEAKELWIHVKADQELNIRVNEEREREERILK